MRDFFGAVLERVGVVCFSQLAAENKIMQARRVEPLVALPKKETRIVL